MRKANVGLYGDPALDEVPLIHLVYVILVLHGNEEGVAAGKIGEALAVLVAIAPPGPPKVLAWMSRRR